MTPIPIVIAGPTGVGKSRLALELAEQVGGEVVNYDSVQIYRGFDIGSAKPSMAERQRVPHHLFDIVEADEHFDAAEFAMRARAICDDIVRRGKWPILAGGTFFYLRALLAGLPELPPRNENIRSRLRRILRTARGRERLHRWLARVDATTAARVPATDRHRVERALEVYITSGSPISAWNPPTASSNTIPHATIALKIPRDKLIRLLDCRVEEMYEAGLVEETQRLLARYSYQCKPFGSIGYREAAKLLAGQMNRDEAISETKRRTRAYAKRQLTWLRAERNVHWIDGNADASNVVRSALTVFQKLET